MLSREHRDLVPAADLPWQTVAACAQDPRAFVRLIAGGRAMPHRAVAALQASWVHQQGLVDGDDLDRLVWIVDHFSRELEVDLLQRVGADLGELWRRRRWRLLLNLIDHLPRTTWSWQAMVNHPEYAQKVADAVWRNRKDQGEEYSAPLIEHTPEVAALASVVDAVNALRTVLMQVNMKPGQQPPKIPPYPRPRTLVDTLYSKKDRIERWVAHERLADRLLPHRREART